MKKISVIILVYAAANAFSMEAYNLKVQKFLEQNELTKAEKLLKRWEKAEADNMELYLAYFHYYVKRAETAGMNQRDVAGSEQNLYENRHYDATFSAHAFKAVDKAISLNPDRLDAYFGKCRFLRLTQNYEGLYTAVNSLLQREKMNGGNWLWEENISMRKKGYPVRRIIVDSLLNYIEPMFYSFEEDHLILEKILILLDSEIPNNIDIMNFTARYYSQIEEYKKSIAVLKNENVLMARNGIRRIQRKQ
ncbi:MAG: hypothetical protein B0D92_08295 [Spirochaeta sp. LUC14_002_19_P3]|nr:MAG: hypothetical protein B0D92_08295 [Spirochaeta sp. LUC14_002_19_P3]